MANVSTTLLRALLLYHLAECQSGNAATIRASLQDHTFKISDNGRVHAMDKTINGLPYLKLVYSQTVHRLHSGWTEAGIFQKPVRKSRYA